ncbi:uncharacterized protein LOC141661311 [Apium graveolens]|uniref:uncharacterized protein LOC141661311 n=1 Tax=Apium graveolens TaxID=4045 RepID=UPI003D7B9E70
MTTNHVESWNNAILEARSLPISSLVRFIFMKNVEYFDERRVEIATQISRGQVFTKYAHKMLSRSNKRATGHNVTVFDRDSMLFQVVTRIVGQKGGNRHTVRLQEGMCSCGKWQNYRIPCSDLVVCCAYLNMSHERFVGDFYRLDNVSKVYDGVFEPIPTKGDPRWPSGVELPKVMHDKELEKKKGRRKSTRFKNAMDFQASRGKN